MLERDEGLPAAVLRALVEAGERAGRVDQVELAVAGEIEELLARVEIGRGGLQRHQLGGAKRATRLHRRRSRLGGDRAEVALVEPGAGLLGQDAGEPSPSRSTHW